MVEQAVMVSWSNHGRERNLPARCHAFDVAQRDNTNTLIFW